MSRLLVGTDDGLLVVDEGAAGWNVVYHILEGREINSIALTGVRHALIAARDEGLVRVYLADGKCERLGATTLPSIVRTVALSPHNLRQVFVGTEPAAIFASEDGGEHWRELTAVSRLRAQKQWKYPVPTIGDHIRHIVVDRETPHRLYAAVQVGGIVRSEDGGTTWTHVADGLDPDVHTILQHPHRPAVLYAVCGGGGYPGAPGDAVPYPPPLPQGRPIYRSLDRGVSWECVSLDFSRTYGVPMQYVGNGSLMLYAAVARDIPPFWAKRPEKADAVLIQSPDDGTTWTEVGGGLPAHFPDMIEVIAIDPSDPKRLFLATGGEGMKMLPADERAGRVFHSDRDGRNWSLVPIEFPSIFTLTVM